MLGCWILLSILPLLSAAIAFCGKQIIYVKREPVVPAKPVQVRIDCEYVQTGPEARGGLKAVNIKNDSGERRVFKVTCPDEQLYQVHSVYSVIEAGQTGRIEVLRNNGTNKMDKLILLSAKVDGDVSDLKNFFAKIDNQEQHSMDVQLIVDA